MNLQPIKLIAFFAHWKGKKCFYVYKKSTKAFLLSLPLANCPKPQDSLSLNKESAVKVILSSAWNFAHKNFQQERGKVFSWKILHHRGAESSSRRCREKIFSQWNKVRSSLSVLHLIFHLIKVGPTRRRHMLSFVASPKSSPPVLSSIYLCIGQKIYIHCRRRLSAKFPIDAKGDFASKTSSAIWCVCALY